MATTRRAARAGIDLARSLRPSSMPASVELMLCSLVDQPFDHPSWVFEPKYDGLRVLGRFERGRVTLLSRNNQPQDFQFPDVVNALEAGLKKPALVDGEVVCFDDRGRTSFRMLQQRFHLKDEDEVRERSRKYPAYIYLFDLLYFDRYDLRGLPLHDRKQVLRQAVRWSDDVRWTETTVGRGKRLLAQACRQGQEGIIGKHLDSRYVGGRSSAWVKVKCIGRQEFVIGGFTDPQRSRVGLGALLVGYYGNDRKQLLYAGKVGTGYTCEMLLDLRRRLDALEQKACPFDRDDRPCAMAAHWVKPRLVAEIAFSEWTQNDRLRQPRFEGLRPDKKPRDCVRERPRHQTELAR